MRFPCPTCGSEFDIPVAPTPPDGSSSGSGQTTLRKRCHGCGVLCAPDTVICVDCGYNFNTRETVTTEMGDVDDEGDLDLDVDPDAPHETFTETDSGLDYFDAAESQLGKIAIFMNEKGAFEPPPGPRDQDQVDFVEQLNVGRVEALELRKEHKRIQPLGDQAFDPLDNPLPNIHSLAILFDRDVMDDAYAWQMLLAFLRRVKPSGLRKKMVVHAGILLGFQNLCAVVVRSQMAKDLEYVARQFGQGFETDWILPYRLRFLRADKSDGHRLQRAFCIPIELILEAGVIHPDRNGVAGRTITEECVATLDWRLPELTIEEEYPEE